MNNSLPELLQVASGCHDQADHSFGIGTVCAVCMSVTFPQDRLELLESFIHYVIAVQSDIHIVYVVLTSK